MPTIKRPPKLLLIALATMLAFWGVSGGSALASTGGTGPVDALSTEEASTEPSTGETDAAGEDEPTEAGGQPEQQAPGGSADGDAGTETPSDEKSDANEIEALTFDGEPAGAEAELRADAIPVTNETELQQAMWDIPIRSAGTIELQNDFTVSSAIDAPFNRVITLTSKEGSTFTITQTAANERHFDVDGGSSSYDMSLILENVTLDGDNVGGGVLIDGKRGTLTLKAGATIQNCTSSAFGGGVHVNRGALSIEGGTIKANTTTKSDTTRGGGGVYATGGTVTLSSGSVENNNARNGGGLNLDGSSTFTMTGGVITGNSNTSNYGAGVTVGGGSSFTMSGSALIEKNTDTGAGGGGVMVYKGDSVFTMESGTIRANTAVTRGGGVCVYGNASFVMNGGVIGGEDPSDANTAESGGGVNLYSDWMGNDPSFTMTGSSLIKNNTADQGGGVSRYNTATATLKMYDNATITENFAEVGGGMYLGGGSITYFDMYGSSSVHHNTATRSGGGIDSISTEFTMHDTSSVHHNTAGGWEGGVAHWSNDLMIMNDSSSVHDNETTSSGGGIAVTNRAGLVMNDQATVVDNTAGENGGGIFTEYSAATPANPTSLTMNGGTVARNTALGSEKGGGGIFFDGQANKTVTLFISGDSVIIDNSAPNGHGGGIYSNEPYWGQMVIGPDTVFDRNTASAAYIPPATVFADYPSIEFSSISIAGLVPHHPLNNYDINFTGGTPATTYKVTYHGNGNDAGDPPATQFYVEGAEVTVSDEATLGLTDHDFLGWSTDPLATDAEYEAADTFNMPARDVDLYAVWKAQPPAPVLHTVTYHGNGHDAGDPHPSAQYAAGEPVTVLDKNTLGLTDHEFIGWHTDPTSETALYSPADGFSMPANDVDLHAIWKAKTPAVLYTVTYHGNGNDAGEVHPSAQYAENAPVTVLDKNTLARDGYEFIGWHTDPSASTALYSPADGFAMPAHDVDLHAIWKAVDPGDPEDPDPKNPDPTDPDSKDPEKPGDGSSGKTGSVAKLARTGDAVSILPFAAVALAGLLAAGGAYAIAKRRNN